MTDAITTAPHGQGRGCVITRRACFSSSHRYWLPELSADDNAARFGSCAMAPGHGHNYELIVSMARVPRLGPSYWALLLYLFRGEGNPLGPLCSLGPVRLRVNFLKLVLAACAPLGGALMRQYSKHSKP